MRAVVAALVLGLVLAAAPAASAQEAEPEPTEEPPPPTPSLATGGAPRLDLVGQTPFVAPTDVLRVDLTLLDVPDGAELTFTLRSSVYTATGPTDPRTPQQRFDQWAAGRGDRDADPFNSPRTFPAANLPPGDGPGRVTARFQIVPLTEPEPQVGFQIADPGVYPLTIDLHEAGSGTVLDTLTTFLVRLPPTTEDAPPLAVAPIVGLRAPVALRPDGTRRLDPTALERIRLAVDALAARPEVALTVDPTPETLESLVGVPASSEPGPGGQGVLDRLRTSLADRSMLGSTYVRLDIPAWMRSGMQDALAYQRSHGINVTEAVVGEGVAIDAATWVASPDLDGQALGALHQLGVDQLVLDGAVVGPVDPRAFPDASRAQVASVQPFDVETDDGTLVRAVATDADFGERLHGTEDPELNAQILVSDLAVTYFGSVTGQFNDVSSAPRGVAFEVPDDELALRSLDPFLGAIATTPPPEGGGVAIVDPATLADLFRLPPAVVDGATAVRSFTPVTDPDAPQDMGSYPERLDDAEFALAAYESMVVDTRPDLVVPLRQLLDVSGAAGFRDDERDAYLDASTATVDRELAGVQVPEQDPITLTTAEYELPIVVQNDLTYPVTARVELSSSKLDFPDGDDVEVRLEPGRNRIPVRVKTVSSGTFPVDLAVRTPDSRVELGEQVIQVRSTAVSGWGLALSIGAGFFLLVWWARNWRSTRRTPVGEASEAGGRPPDDGAGPARFTVGALDDLDDAEPVERR